MAALDIPDFEPACIAQLTEVGLLRRRFAGSNSGRQLCQNSSFSGCSCIKHCKIFYYWQMRNYGDLVQEMPLSDIVEGVIMLRFLFSILILALLSLGGYWIWNHRDVIPETIINKLPSHEIQTLEIRHLPEEIMQKHRGSLLRGQGYSFLEPKLLFYPYLLLDVKYANHKGMTTEGVLLWGLNDGEMITHTTTWDKTHGCEDCLVAHIEKNQFKILEVLAEHGGLLDREKIYEIFKLDQEILDRWIDGCRSKNLIVVSGHKLRLHFQNPYLPTEPMTHFDRPLVTQPAKIAHRIKGRYSPSQIQHFAQIAFGKDFAIRRTEEVFLPVYAITVQNPDGSQLTTFWNALNGHQLEANACR